MAHAEEYFKQYNISNILSKAMAELYEQEPINPVEKLAQILLRYNNSYVYKNQIKEMENWTLKMKQHEIEMQEQESVKSKEDEEEAKKQKLISLLKSSEDPLDHFQEVITYLKQKANATEVYAAKITKDIKEVRDEDDENAHIDSAAVSLLRCVYDTDGTVLGKILPEDGIVSELFKKKEVVEKVEGGENEEEKKKVAKDQNKESTENGVFIKDVLYEPKLKFFAVPRLGCFFATKFNYNSCLSEESLDKAVEEYAKYLQKKAEQDALKAQREDENKKMEEEKKEAGEPYVAPTYTYEPITEPPYNSIPICYVLVLDTLGQARIFTPAEKESIYQMIATYVQIIEESENIRLTSDKILRSKHKKLTEELVEAIRLQGEEADKAKEDAIAAVTEENVPQEEINQKGELAKYRKNVEFIVGAIIKPLLKELSKYYIFKPRKILQAIFYFLGYTRDEICIPKTTRLDWLKVRSMINDSLFDKILNYNPIGPKTQTYAKYATLNFIEKLLDSVKEEEVAEYSALLPLLYKWLKYAITIRKADIKYRREQKASKDKERAEAIEKNNALAKAQEEALQSAIATAKADFKAPENPDDFETEEEYLNACKFVFDEKAFLEEYKTQNPETPVPDAVPEFKDNDYIEEQS